MIWCWAVWCHNDSRENRRGVKCFVIRTEHILQSKCLYLIGSGGIFFVKWHTMICLNHFEEDCCEREFTVSCVPDMQNDLIAICKLRY